MEDYLKDDKGGHFDQGVTSLALPSPPWLVPHHGCLVSGRGTPYSNMNTLLRLFDCFLPHETVGLVLFVIKLVGFPEI